MVFLGIILLIPLIACIGIFLYCWKRLREAIYKHIPPNIGFENLFPLPREDHTFSSVDGTKLAGWFIPVKNAKATVILVHGYTPDVGGKSYLLAHAEYIVKAGYSVFMFDFRSFGASPGNKIYFGTKEWQDISAAYDYVKKMPENKHKKVGICAASMGAAAAIVSVGLSGKADFLIAVVPYASFDSLYAEQIKKEGFPPFLVLPFMKLATIMEYGWNYTKYTPVNTIKKIHVPIFLISAKFDEFLNANDPKLLFDLANEPKKYWQAEATHDIHKDLRKKMEDKIVVFLDEVCK